MLSKSLPLNELPGWKLLENNPTLFDERWDKQEEIAKEMKKLDKKDTDFSYPRLVQLKNELKEIKKRIGDWYDKCAVKRFIDETNQAKKDETCQTDPPTQSHQICQTDQEMETTVQEQVAKKIERVRQRIIDRNSSSPEPDQVPSLPDAPREIDRTRRSTPDYQPEDDPDAIMLPAEPYYSTLTPERLDQLRKELDEMDYPHFRTPEVVSISDDEEEIKVIKTIFYY